MSASSPSMLAVAAFVLAGFFVIGRQQQQQQRSSCCPPGSINSRNAVQAGCTTAPQGQDLVLEQNTRCYVTKPAAGDVRGIVVMFHDIFGLSSGRTRQVADEMAQWGYLVVVPDFFDDHQEHLGDGADMYSASLPWHLATFASRGQIPFARVERRLYEVILPFADAATAGKQEQLLPIALTGFCWGGWAITRLAGTDSSGRIKCAVGFHPSPDVQALQRHGPKTEDMYLAVKCPLLYLPGWNDPSWLKPPSGSAIQALQRAQPESQSVHFAGMMHGWVNRGDLRDANVKQDYAKAMQLAREYFNRFIT